MKGASTEGKRASTAWPLPEEALRNRLALPACPRLGGRRQAAPQLAPSPVATILSRPRSALDCSG